MPGHSTDAPCFSRSLKAITDICTYIGMGTNLGISSSSHLA